MKRIFLISIGTISLVLGIIGIVLPILPTTPFLILSAASYARSSDKLYSWLIHHRLFGSYILSFIKYRAISLGAKISSITALWLVIGASALFFIDQLWLRVLLAVIAVCVTVYLLSLKTLTGEMTENLYSDEDIRE